MSKVTTLLFYFVMFFGTMLISCSQTTVTNPPKNVSLQLNDTTLSNAYITDYYPNTNFKNDGDFAAIAWLDSSHIGYIGRTIFNIDLSFIPQNATVTSAQLILNYDRFPIHYGGPGHNKDSGSNACYMQRITQSWRVDSVNWSNQPATTTSEQISLNASTSFDENYTVDMTTVIGDMVTYPSSNFGFILRLQIESPIRALAFSSGSTSNLSYRPVLQVTYTTP